MDATVSSNISCETVIVRNWDEFMQLAGEWNDLLRKSRADSVFLTWEWIWSWIEATERSHAPYAVVVRSKKGALLGVAPFYVSEYRLMGLIPCRILRVMADYPTGSEYPSWIVHRDHESSVQQLIAERLWEMRQQWDAIWMPNLAAWTGIHERLQHTCREVGLHCSDRTAWFSYTDLPGDTDEFLGGLSANMRSTLRRQLKKISSRPDVTIDRCMEDDRLAEFLQALFDLHYRRWSTKGEQGVFRRKPTERLFYEIFTLPALKAGWLRLYALRDSERIRAVQIGYVYNNVFHLLQEGFDPEYFDGAGNVLRYRVMEACIQEGIASYDFLGGVSEHKRRWRAIERKGCDLLVLNPNMKSRFLRWAGIWPTGRFLKPASDINQPDRSEE